MLVLLTTPVGCFNSIHLALSSLKTIKHQKDGIIADAAENLISNLERRLPLTEELVAAAILDPSIQHLEVIDNCLDMQKMTR